MYHHTKRIIQSIKNKFFSSKNNIYFTSFIFNNLVKFIMLKYFYLIGLFIIFIFQNIYCQISQEDKITATITGSVYNSMTKKPAIGITIRLLGTNLGAFSSNTGSFKISGVKPGVYSLQFTGVGYYTYIKPDIVVLSGHSAEVEVELAEKVIQLKSAEVKAGYFIRSTESVTSQQTLGREEIRRAPGVQEDVIRATSLLPGVGVTQAGRNDLVVRGGAPFENLFIVDNLEFPNLNHFGTQGSSGGPLALINIDFVNNVTFSSGGFSSLYGDKVSSITNISLRNGNSDRMSGEVNLSATGFGASIEGPITDGSSYLFSIRRSYLDFIFKAAKFSFIPEYWDLQGKANWKLNEWNNISFLFIGALDNVKLNNELPDDRYKNSMVASPMQNQYFTGITWQTVFVNGYGKITLGRTFTFFNTTQNDSLLIPILKNISYEGENTLKVFFAFRLLDNFELEFGNQTKYASNLQYEIEIPAYLRTDNLGIPKGLSVDTSFNCLKNATFINMSAFMGQFKFTFGGRMDYFDYTDSKTVFSPRLSITYDVNPVSSIIFSAGRYYQSPSYIWLIGGSKNLQPICAEQLVIGYDHSPMEDVKVQLEGYYKRYSGYPARVYRPQAVLAPSGFENIASDIPYGLEPLSSNATGTSIGIELLIQKKLSEIPFYGLLSLSISQTEFTSLDEVVRKGAFDSRFIFNLVAGWRFAKDWELSGKFRMAQGLPTTPYLVNGTMDYSRYNEGERLDLFHQLDCRLDKKWNFESLSMVTYIDIQDVYRQKNVAGLQWDFRKKEVVKMRSFGILPSIGVSVQF
ncbi:MAG: TonB-dependent receptor plug [Ignavibacteria bacterium]|nr:TonB-dependent receptor plug [Ignavibacteria bacterium]